LAAAGNVAELRNPACRISYIWYNAAMNMTRLGKKGQVSIPKSILDRLGLEPETVLLVESSDDGSIVLRPAAVYPVETYSDERVSEFLEEDRLTASERRKLASRARKAR
jgi:AbrB family looped-hinge helix DNA binding protein